MISINVEDSRFTVKLGYIAGAAFNTVIDEFRKIEKRLFVKENKSWTFPNAALQGLCAWFQANGHQYTLKDQHSVVKVFNYAGKVTLEIAVTEPLYMKVSSFAKEIRAGDEFDTLFIENDEVEEVLNIIIGSGEYKYELHYRPPTISPNQSSKNEKRANPCKVESAKPRKAARK